MPNPVTTSDLSARWLFDTPIPSDDKLQAKLDDAWRHLLSRDRGVEGRLTAGTLAVDDVVTVVSAIALRVLGNPAGKRQESIDDYSWTRDNAVSAGEMYVTDDELRMLAPTYTSTTRGSVRLVAYGDL
jgi:hypothetical protein